MFKDSSRNELQGSYKSSLPPFPPPCIWCLIPLFLHSSQLDYSHSLNASLTFSSLLICSRFPLPGTHSPLAKIYLVLWSPIVLNIHLSLGTCHITIFHYNYLKHFFLLLEYKLRLWPQSTAPDTRNIFIYVIICEDICVLFLFLWVVSLPHSQGCQVLMFSCWRLQSFRSQNQQFPGTQKIISKNAPENRWLILGHWSRRKRDGSA